MIVLYMELLARQYVYLFYQVIVLIPLIYSGLSCWVCKSKSVGNPLNIRKDRGAVTFAKWPKLNLHLPMPVVLPKGYPVELKAIGDHIRKKRIDMGLLQRDVAEIIGVSKQTLCYWEGGIFNPEIMHIPKIIEFLGYIPFECNSDDPIERLKYFNRVKGMSYERLGKVMNRNPEQLMDWLSGRIRPCKRNIESISKFLNLKKRKRTVLTTDEIDKSLPLLNSLDK